MVFKILRKSWSNGKIKSSNKKSLPWLTIYRNLFRKWNAITVTVQNIMAPVCNWGTWCMNLSSFQKNLKTSFQFWEYRWMRLYYEINFIFILKRLVGWLSCEWSIYKHTFLFQRLYDFCWFMLPSIGFKTLSTKSCPSKHFEVMNDFKVVPENVQQLFITWFNIEIKN